MRGFDSDCAGFQTRRRHRPDITVGATGPADVVAAVEYAAAQDMPVAVQGTGHALAATAGEGGVLINTARMRGFRIDPVVRTAYLEAGVRWDAFVPEVARFGLAPLSGSAPSIAAVPCTLGGGIGLLSREFGYASDLVRGIDVVTPDGRLRHITAEDRSELFWALRGARDNFGVVVGMEIELLPVSRTYGGGMYFHGPSSVGSELVAEFRKLAPAVETVREMAYAAGASIYNEPPAGAFEATNILLDRMDSEAVRTLMELAGPHATTPNMVELRHLGGKLGARPRIDSAVGGRDSRYLLLMASRGSEKYLAAARSAHNRLVDAMTPWGTGGRCLNFLTCDGSPEMVRSCYDEADYARLRQLKRYYDPRNLFRHNHNIPPAGNGAMPAG